MTSLARWASRLCQGTPPSLLDRCPEVSWTRAETALTSTNALPAALAARRQPALATEFAS